MTSSLLTCTTKPSEERSTLSKEKISPLIWLIPAGVGKWDKGIMEPIQKFLRQRDCSKLFKMTE